MAKDYRKYEHKIPRKAAPLPSCHWNKARGHRQKAKRPFPTQDDAESYMKQRHLENEYCAYQCQVCGKWHIGHRKYDNRDYV